MTIGKYTYIYNMLSLYSSRKILCLLKKTNSSLGAEGGKKGESAGWAFFFHIHFEDFETHSFNSLF